MVLLASFDSLPQARAYAHILDRAGIPSQIKEERWEKEEDSGWFPEEEVQYQVWVHPEDEEDAALVVEHADLAPELEASGQKDMLLGTVLGGVGLLTGLGDMPGVEPPWSWIPYGLALAGGILFYKGIREEQAAKQEQDRS